MVNDSQLLEENGTRAMSLMFRAVAEAISKISPVRAEREPEDGFALDAAKKAYLKTTNYFAALRNKGTLSRREEIDIAKSWEATASMLGKYDPSLKPRLSAKATYWHEDGKWSAENVERAVSELETVRLAIASRP